MGSKYTTLSSSGYNSSPPADDGSQTASNLITWSGIKSKLADPPKNLADAINTALVTAFDYSVRQISSSDNTVASDHMKCVEIAPTVTTAITVSLGDAATMTNNYRVFVKNSSARNETVGLVTAADTLDGTANGTFTLTPGAAMSFAVNQAATGYIALALFDVVNGTTSSTFTFNGSGATTGSLAMAWRKEGNFVTLNLPAASAASGTGSTALVSNTALPTSVRPASTQRGVLVNMLDNASGVSASGMFSISTGGILSIFRDGAGNVFTNSATAGTQNNQTIVYFVG